MSPEKEVRAWWNALLPWEREACAAALKLHKLSYEPTAGRFATAEWRELDNGERMRIHMHYDGVFE